ncbi:hypothetical protein SASPL_124823 [Salvia splendens]|uniref:GIR1-like zinc ribbon domain-containing protein n=1 Tax=Salvia splendens TaxID=180675 RepID=A0A8X8ZQ72_SALSN|nr:protein GL2-INTERACTING REPRESSOR 1 [Salvia splendens]KAG6412154.1 hypothetical protein SASPL_124823 [Salvia splendens]
MSRRNGAKLDLKLNLSPPRAGRRVSEESPRRRSPSVSPTSSCVSSEANHQEDQFRYLEGHEENSMMLVGCPRCLMYVMLSEEDPRCPQCKSTVLLDFLHDTATSATKNNKN